MVVVEWKMAKNPRLIVLTGQRFGLWTIGTQAGNSPRGGALWHATCDCGQQGTPMGADLRSGKSTSCGCLQRAAARKVLRTHGESKTRLYRIWKSMHTRCYNENVPDYVRYGGRGIGICDAWRTFEPFRDWALASGYAADLSIDRIDNDIGYQPSNCRWATAETQSQNRRFVRRSPDGRPWSAIAKAHGLKTTTMHCRLNEGWPIELAASLPLGSRWRQAA